MYQNQKENKTALIRARTFGGYRVYLYDSYFETEEEYYFDTYKEAEEFVNFRITIN